MTERKTVRDIDKLRPDLVANVRDKHGCTVTFNGIHWTARSEEGDSFPLTDQARIRMSGPFTYELETRRTTKSLRGIPDDAIDVQDRYGCEISRTSPTDFIWGYLDEGLWTVNPASNGPFTYELETRLTTEYLSTIPADAVDVQDRHGRELSWVTPTDFIWGYPDEELRTVNPSTNGPFTYEVLESATEAAPDADLMARIAKMEGDDKSDSRYFDEAITMLKLGVTELASKFNDAHNSLDTRLTALESSVRVLEDKIPGAVADAPAGTTLSRGEYRLTEVPEGINTVWDVDNGQAIHRLADGGWMFGLVSGGFPDEATGEMVDLPEVYRVATTPSED